MATRDARTTHAHGARGAQKEKPWRVAPRLEGVVKNRSAAKPKPKKK